MITTVISGHNQGVYFGGIGTPHIYVDHANKAVVIGIAGPKADDPAIVINSDGEVSYQTFDQQGFKSKALNAAEFETRLKAFIRSFE